MRGQVAIIVDWDDGDCDCGMLSQTQTIPREIYDAGYLDGDAVSEYLTEKSGHCVKDWRLR